MAMRLSRQDCWHLASLKIEQVAAKEIDNIRTAKEEFQEPKYGWGR